MRRQTNSLVLVTLVALMTAPAWAQEAPHEVPGAATVVATGGKPIPDLSGVWTRPSWPGFDPPASGPGPVVNRSRTPNGVGDTAQLVGDYTNPILKPEAAAVVKEHGRISLTGTAYPTPANQCWPQPVPYIFWNLGMQMIQQPDQITFLYDKDHEVRRVRMNQPHPAHVTPSWYGDSVGRYEGDTLVVDTVGIRTERPFGMVDVYGTPYTEALHVVERYRLLDPQAILEAQKRGFRENRYLPVNDSGLIVDPNKGTGLYLEFTVEDPGVFTKPWSAAIAYRRASGEWPEYICSDNRREYYSGKDTNVPHADRPEF